MAEAEYLLHLAKRLAYLTDKDYVRVEELRGKAAKLLYGLIDSVKKEV